MNKRKFGHVYCFDLDERLFVVALVAYYVVLMHHGDCMHGQAKNL